MTAEEAIKIVERIQDPDPWEPPITGKAFEALEMAVEAMSAIDQYKWERDVAILQLKALGYELGEKIRTDDDCISRQAAIDELKERLHANGYSNVALVSELNRSIGYLMRLPSVQPEPHWIPVSERLPEEGERVLATHLGGVNPNNQIIEHIFQCGKFTYGWDMDMNVDSPTFGQRYMGEVIAWMPLPKPYKGES